MTIIVKRPDLGVTIREHGGGLDLHTAVRPRLPRLAATLTPSGAYRVRDLRRKTPDKPFPDRASALAHLLKRGAELHRVEELRARAKAGLPRRVRAKRTMPARLHEGTPT